jgi:hypothetical protein
VLVDIGKAAPYLDETVELENMQDMLAFHWNSKDHLKTVRQSYLICRMFNFGVKCPNKVWLN